MMNLLFRYPDANTSDILRIVVSSNLYYKVYNHKLSYV